MADNNTEKKTRKKGIGFKIFMFIAFFVLVALTTALAIFLDTISTFGVYDKTIDQAWRDESQTIANRYAVMILADADEYLIGEEASPNLKYGVVESFSPDLTDEDLENLDIYVYNNFDEKFNIHKCNIFSARIDGGTYFNYGMNTIFEGAYLSHDVWYEPEPGEEVVYKYVVSYVDRPTESNALTSTNLFIQLNSWLVLAYKVKYLTIVAMAIVCILLLVDIAYWFITCVKFIVRIIRKLAFVPKTTVSLLLFTFVGAFFTGILGAMFDFEELFILFLLADIFIIAPIVVYVSYQTKLLSDACSKLAQGDMDVHVKSSIFFGNFRKQAESINAIRDSINLAVEERMKSERFKTELITNVSHDIKTPLTSIINYVDLLGKEEFDNDTAREYLEVLDRQSVRLKKLIIDLIEASKAATGNIELEMMPCDAKLILEQVVGEYQEKMDEQNISLVVRTPESSATIMADSKSLFRIFDNLLVNIRKYSMENTRAYVDLELVGDKVVFVFRNTSKEQLDADGSLFMERFYQGDISRSTEGNGLGLTVAKSLTELMNGEIHIVTDGDLFKVTISFDACID